MVLGAHPGVGEELLGELRPMVLGMGGLEAGTSNGVQGAAGYWKYNGKGIGEGWKRGNEMV